MKDFNVENTDRKTPYRLPENTFKQMQTNVLQKVTPVKKARIFDLKIITGIAASLLLMMGLVFFIKNNQSTSQLPIVVKKKNQNKAFNTT